MTVSGRSLSAAALLAAAALAIPAAGYAAERTVPVLGYNLDDYAPPAPEQVASDQVADAAVDGDAVRCLAKVVHHEARYQPRSGQIAVARTLINRLARGRFGDSICAVANQPGQYFALSSYHPDESSDGWQQSVGVARDALRGSGADAAPGALFFRAAYVAPTSFFRTRQRVAAIGDHIFYR